jgi:hypothetical protein
VKTRIIQTRFWKDEYVKQLSTEEKLVFLFLLSNETVNLVGTYQVYPQEIALWCDISVQKATQCLEKFTEDRKFFYKNGWIKIINYEKYQNYGGGTQQKAYEKELEQIPEYMHQHSLDTSIDTNINTSIDGSMDTTYNTEIRNKKSEIRNKKQESEEKIGKNINTLSKFISSKQEILTKSLDLYPDKNCTKAIEDFIEYCEIKSPKYSKYDLAFLRWVREDKFNQYKVEREKVTHKWLNPEDII